MPVNSEDGITIPVDQTIPEPKAQPKEEKYFSEEDVQKIRQQEKDKMYKRLEDSDGRVKQMEEQLNLLTREREQADRKSTRLNSSHVSESRMPSSA